MPPKRPAKKGRPPPDLGGNEVPPKSPTAYLDPRTAALFHCPSPRLCELYHGPIFDPACGSGAMFIQSGRRLDDFVQMAEAKRAIMFLTDCLEPENNDFGLTSKLGVARELYLKWADLVGFANGLPLVLIELKNPGVNVREAFGKNLCDYQATIPQNVKG